jgi:glycosyltransferase involved in cell wall biosynthesis
VPGSKILYITYDGLADPLGRSQVLPYLAGLGRLGHQITVLSCEKPYNVSRDSAEIKALCKQSGITWHPLRYRKHPPIVSGALDAQSLKREAVRLHKEQGFDIVHCRSYIPAMAGLALKRRYGVRFLFDVRGMWPDERLESGSWPRFNPIYRIVYAHLKRLEVGLFREADHIVSLTDAGEKHLRATSALAGQSPAITVIPCCADFDHFPLINQDQKAASRRRLNIKKQAKVLVYLGSIGPVYMLDEMIDFFKVYVDQHPEAMLLFMTQEPQRRLASLAAARGIPDDRIMIRAASRAEVPVLMAAADTGLFFIRPTPSKVASSPAKMGEMMALGLPIVTNAGVGDVAEIMADSGGGVVLRSLDPASYAAAICELDRVQIAPEEIRAGGRRWYDLAEGIKRYDLIYRGLSNQ